VEWFQAIFDGILTEIKSLNRTCLLHVRSLLSLSLKSRRLDRPSRHDVACRRTSLWQFLEAKPQRLACRDTLPPLINEITGRGENLQLRNGYNQSQLGLHRRAMYIIQL